MRPSIPDTLEIVILKLVLVQPNFDLPFTIETDASKHAIGAALSQTIDGDRRFISFFSRSMTPAERHYDVKEQELLAIIEALRHWRHYLHGSPHQFTVYTDHLNLIALFKSRLLNSLQIRWSQELAEIFFCHQAHFWTI